MGKQQNQNKNYFFLLVIFFLLLIIIFLSKKGFHTNFIIFFSIILIILGIYFFLFKLKISKYIFLGSIIFFILIFFIFFFKINTTKTNSKILSSKEICKAYKLKEKINPEFKLNIVSNNNVFQKIEKSNFTKNELKNLSYGYSLKEPKNGIYTVLEICKGEKSISQDSLNTNMFHKADPKLGSNNAGNYENFTNIQGLENLEPGTYTIYLYTSTNGKDRTISQKLDFEIN